MSRVAGVWFGIANWILDLKGTTSRVTVRPLLGWPVLLAGILSYALIASSASVPSSPRPRPNVLIILTDDQGWGDLSFHGNTNLSTPALDRLASSGVRFDRFYVSPVCSPTRAEFLTGLYHPRTGVHDVSTGGERMNLDCETLPEVFRKSGYVTGAFGKWHNGSQYPYHPNGRGFDEFYGYTSGHWGTYFDAPLERNGQPVQSRGFLTDVLTDEAIRFIERHQDRPFVCYLPLNTPHSPMQVPEKFFRKFADWEPGLQATATNREDVRFTRAALAMCENIDWNVGRLLQRLEDLKLTEKTLVVFFTDNGPNSHRWNGGMRGIKGSVDEGGVRSPLFVSWRGRLQPRSVEPICGAIDLLPTIAELAGLDWKPQRKLDGRSLVPLLEGRSEEWPKRTLFSHWNGRVSARDERFRLDAENRLYDMRADPGQTRNVANLFPTEFAGLRQVLEAWKAGMFAGNWRVKRPFTVGYPEFPRTSLPARDGVPSGGVKRSAPAPNCSFFENWTSSEGAITWNIEVATPGRYEVELMYACPNADTGAQLELTFLGTRLSGVVTTPNEKPLQGAENDRFPRQSESYVKNWKVLRLGTVEWPKGQGPLRLSAPKIPGSMAMELSEVVVRLVEDKHKL